MLKRLFTPGRTQAFDKQIPAGTDNAWVSFEGSNYGLPMEPGVYAVTVIPSAGVTLQNVVGVNLFADNSYDWVNFQPGVAVRLYWKSKGELRFRATSTNGGYVTVLVTPVTNSLSLSLSLSLVESVTAFIRRWRHGAKESSSRAGGVFLQRRSLGNFGRYSRRVAHLESGTCLPASRNLLAGIDGDIHGGATPLRNGSEDRPAESSHSKGRRLLTVHVCHKGRCAHAYQAGLAAVGGGC